MNALTCPNCGGDLDRVTDSRPHDYHGVRVIKRARKCRSCGQNSPSIEIPERLMSGLIRAIAQKVAADFLESFK